MPFSDASALTVCQARIMQRDEYLAHLVADGGRIASLADDHADAGIPTCPDWTMQELAEHVRWVLAWLSEAAAQGVSPDVTTMPIPDTIEEGVRAAVAKIADLDPARATWTWAHPDGGDSAQWYFRRLAHEILVHRLDAELGAGEVTAVDPALAADGVDEFCEVFVPVSAGVADANGETLHLHATDAECEWLLTMRPEGIDATPGHAKGDAAIRAGALDLLLMSWGREPLGAIEVFGDEEVVRRFRAAPRA
jgi:uncharacterized protein (TIGR03083 family)